MSKSVNKVLLLGNLGKDPVIKRPTQNFVVAEMSLATTERSKDKTGNWVDVTEWHNLVATNKLAEFCGNYLKKGARVFIEGKIKTRKWKDQATNEDRSMVAVQIEEVVMCSDDRPAQTGQQSATRPAQSTLPDPDWNF